MWHPEGPPPPLLEAQKTRGDILFKCGQVKYFSEISCLALPSRVKGGDEESHIQQLVLKHRICQTSKKQNPVPQVSFCQQAAFLSETPVARQHHRIHASLGKLWLLLGQCSPLITRRLALPERLLRSSLRQWEKDPWKRCIPCRKIMEIQSWLVGQRWSESLHRPAYDPCWLNSTYHWRTSTGQMLVFESRCCFHILCLSFGPVSQSATEPTCSEHLWAIRIVKSLNKWTQHATQHNTPVSQPKCGWCDGIAWGRGDWNSRSCTCAL